MLRDIWLSLRREQTLALRNPAWIGIGIMQPVLYLFLFGPLMERIVDNTPGFPPGSAWVILTPALILQLGLFSLFAGFGILADLRSGALERMRVTPVRRLALLLGKVLNAGIQLLVQALLILVLALLVFDLEAPAGGILLSLLIVVMLGIALASCSYALALKLKSEEAFIPLLNTILLPVLLLSGILIPITTGLAPGWLYTISRINPMTHIVDAGRASFRGDFAMDALFTGCVVLAVMTVLSVWWGARTFQKENA
ncbi:MAG TPA: ABC transporter permease [Actinophytocola sp.]|uniref:ABC transporter permease n=1 Tax=Actinophytocola sp. TaxID=1872138 RepID=UPI002DBB7B51|nr:ABC transporter permease [Actinophytocola sp.]HEU5475763.1 ABC transporter permease [Actinophytocola sp.]